MGRYYWRRKPTAEESCDLSIYWLKKYGYLSGRTTGGTAWTSSRTGKTTSVLLEVDMIDKPHVTLIYSLTDREGNKADYKYDVSLLTTSCNYGGVRYWFACPLCDRRVGAIYLAPGSVYFKCRHCNNITYHSRNRCKIGALGHTSRQIDKLRGEIKRCTWRGQPTRKVRRLYVLQRKAGVLGEYAMAQANKFKARISKR